MLNGFGGNTPVLLNRWMSASMTEVKHLLQSKAGKAQRGGVTDCFSIEFFLAAIIPQPGSHAFRRQITVIGFSGGKYIQFFSPVYRISYWPSRFSHKKAQKAQRPLGVFCASCASCGENLCS